MINSDLFQRAPELILNLCTLGGSQKAVCPSMRHTAYRPYEYGSLLSFHNWNVHDFVQEPDMSEASAPSEIGEIADVAYWAYHPSKNDYICTSK